MMNEWEMVTGEWIVGRLLGCGGGGGMDVRAAI
jgi:hypothetical protein